MFDSMKCIKTGCDVTCDEFSFHGDLFCSNGILILSGVPYNGDYYPLNDFHHFKIPIIHEVPGTGGTYKTFLLEGKPFDINIDFLNQIKNYESYNIINIFI